MISALKVPKQYGNYADICLTLGLAKLIYTAQLQISDVSKIKLIDQGTSYRIQVAQALEIEEIASTLHYEDLLALHNREMN